ncbi:MAG: site-specific integrase [Syntrophobacteraceae bacterium]
MNKWIKTKYTGIRYREHPTRKHGVRKDRYYTIRYKLDGKDREEKLGWETDWAKAELARKEQGNATGRTLEQEAILRFSELKGNRESGKGPFTLEEKQGSELAKREAKAREKEAEDRAVMPFSAVWEKYIAQAEADGKKSVVREKSFYSNWIEPAIGNKPIAEIAAFHLEDIKRKMKKEGKREMKGEKPGLSPRSIHYCLAVIRQAFNFATRHGFYAGRNPVENVKKPTEDNRRMRFLTFDEAESLLGKIKSASVDCWRITLISLHCGLRFGEIASLVWGDVDSGKNCLCVRNPKNGRTRFVFMTEEVKTALSEMEKGAWSDLVFPARKSKERETGLVRDGQRRRQISDTFDAAVEGLKMNEGIDDPRQRVCFHTCRHSYASWLVQGGTDLFTVKELLGHKSLSMTERYSHLQPETLQKAVNGLNRQLVVESEKRKAQSRSNVVAMPSSV